MGHINYKMAVYLSQKKDSLQLLEYIKTTSKHSKHQNDDEKFYKNEQANNFKMEQYDQMIKKLQNEFSQQRKENICLQKQIKEKDLQLVQLQNKLSQNEKNKSKEIEEYNNDIHTLRNLIKTKEWNYLESENEKKALQQRLDEVTNKNTKIINRLQNELKKIESLQNIIIEKDNDLNAMQLKLNDVSNEDSKEIINKLKMDNVRLTQQNKEEKQSNQRQQTKILKLQRQSQSLRNNRDQTQKINLSQRKQIESMQNEINQLKQQINHQKTEK